MYTLPGKLSQGSSTLVEIKDSYEVASPKLSVTVTAPDVVGNEPFNIAAEIKNEGKGAGSPQSSVFGRWPDPGNNDTGR